MRDGAVTATCFIAQEDESQPRDEMRRVRQAERESSRVMRIFREGFGRSFGCKLDPIDSFIPPSSRTIHGCRARVTIPSHSDVSIYGVRLFLVNCF